MTREQLDNLKERLVKLTNHKKDYEEKKKELVGALSFEIKQTSRRIDLIAQALKDRSFLPISESQLFDDDDLKDFVG